ncbi:3-carboxy-cis,cis-muconate cycloisomerase [Streptacidiphilus sp. MAP12-16]|uniref:3-carboxy-cis,cis-muconate cycloisomerase n=1 Tax=Streptacidiphilus sp. MAP12-16 TaxID=3156300 RepID=UPI0035110D3C
MPSTETPQEPPQLPDDVGLLSPAAAGSAVAAVTGDAAVLQAMLTAEAALVRAQVELGLAPGSAADAVTAAATRHDLGGFDLRSLARRARSGGNPVIPLVADLTAAVAAADPDAAAYVHRGATSQDIMDTALMLVAATALDLTLADLDRTATALARLATEHRDTVMPGRTLTQHAVPTTFGLKAAGWRSLVLDARARLAATRAALPAQLGGAAGTLAAFHAYAEADGAAPDPELGLRLLAAYARQTGLAEPALPWHALRTPVADLGAALAFSSGALGKIAADVLTLSRTEIGELGEGSGGGSSAMPHKANPVRATLIAATARQVPALACVLFGSLVAEDERPAGAWHAEWQPLREALRLVGGAARDAAELTEGLRVHPHRMRTNLDQTDGLIVTEHLAAAFGALIGRGQAKKALSRASVRALEQGRGLDQALAAQPELAGLLTEHRMRELTDPARYLGSSGALVDRALREAP